MRFGLPAGLRPVRPGLRSPEVLRSPQGLRPGLQALQSQGLQAGLREAPKLVLRLAVAIAASCFRCRPVLTFLDNLFSALKPCRSCDACCGEPTCCGATVVPVRSRLRSDSGRGPRSG